jgi:hypothetical protein
MQQRGELPVTSWPWANTTMTAMPERREGVRGRREGVGGRRGWGGEGLRLEVAGIVMGGDAMRTRWGRVWRA